MPKRIALFILGLVIALAAFKLYQRVSGSSYAAHPKGVRVFPTSTQPAETPSYESRDAEGRLEFLITCESFEQLKGPNGEVLQEQVALKKPVGTFFDKSGRTMEIRADTCRAVIDQGFKGSGGGSILTTGAGGEKGATGAGGGGKDKKGGRAAQPLRLGQLSGHVRLLISALPEDAAKPITDPALLARKAGVAVFFDDDLEVDGSQDILSSPGKVHLRSEIADFDGEGLQLAFNRDSRRIEYLQVAKGDQVIIRNVGSKALSFSDNAATAPANPATRSAARPASQPAATQVAGTKPGKEPPSTVPQPTYKLSFGQDVRASVGTAGEKGGERVLTSDRLYLLFMPSSGLAGGDTGSGDNTAVAPAGASNSATTRAGPGDHAEAIAAAGPNDLVVHWTGPMEMRPAGEQELKLVNGQDVALEAVGARDNPVRVRDSRFVASAGRLWYHALAQREGQTELQGVIKLEPEEFGHILLVDPAQGQVDCKEVTIFQKENRVELLGPGTYEKLAAAPVGAVGRAGAASGGSGGGGGATTVAWNDRMDLELAQTRDSKDPANSALAIRRAVIRMAAVRSDTFDLAADLLDVLIANSGDAKQPPALEHLLATGHVAVKSLRRNGANLLPTDLTDGLSAPRLEVLTAATGPNGTLVPSQMIASGAMGEEAGKVKAWRFKDESKEQVQANGALNVAAGALRKEMITTSRLVADLTPKARTGGRGGSGGAEASIANADVAGLGQNFPDVTHLAASGGARVDITPPASSKADPIVVIADSLEADPVASKAVLKADDNLPGMPIRVAMGENSIEGRELEIDQNKNTLDVPGPGQILFTRRANPATTLPDAKNPAAPTPMRVTWTKHMTYDDKEKLAVFTGSPLAQIVDEDPDRGFLKCDEVLKVRGLKDVSTTRPAQGGIAGAGKFELDTIEADGNVDARGEQFGANNALLTRIRISSQKLVFHDVSKTFEIPGAGNLVVDNFRPEKAGDTANTAGTYAFHWEGGLNYDGAAGTINFLDGVRFAFQPTKPFNLASSPLMGGTTTHHPVKEVLLNTDRLVATLAKAKDAVKTTASPIGLGEGGNLEVSKVDAENGAHLYAGEFELIGDTLHFDALTHTAVALGKGEDDAVVIQPGQAQVTAPEIKWDMTKDHNAISFPKGFRGNISGN